VATPVKHSDKNYGGALSGKIGSRPELEQEYVLKFSTVDPKDGVTSLREALRVYAASKGAAAAWDGVLKSQAALQVVKDKLLAAGYTMPDLVKLTLDNS
jgi:hypothetical protein